MLNMCLRIARQLLDRSLQRYERLGVTMQGDQRGASADQIRRVLPTKSEQFVVVSQRFDMTAEQRVRHSAIVQRLRVARLDGERKRETLQGFR